MGTDEKHAGYFRAGIDPDAATTFEKALEEGATEAGVPIKIAAYGKPDSGKPVGVKNRQILDDGCFRGFCSRFPGADPVPLYLDHGNAVLQNGWPSSTLLVGRGDAFREAEGDGLIVDAVYNLRKEIGRDAASDLVFNPRGQRYSFRWDKHETYRGKDDWEHVSEIPEITEFSQMGFGSAQRDTGVVGDITYRAVTPAHSTGTSDEDWDATAMVARLSDNADPSMYRRMFAYLDPDGDPERKGSYAFAHHKVDDGRVGAANVRACSAAIDALNVENTLTGSERRGVYNHLAAHLREAEAEVTALKARMPAADELAEWIGDEGFRAMFLEIVKGNDPLIQAMQADEGLRARMMETVQNADSEQAASVAVADYFDRFTERKDSKWEQRVRT